MKRIKIVIIILAVCVAAAVGVYFTASYISNRNAKKAAEEAAKLVIFDFDENAVNNVRIHNESGDYEMKYTQSDGWQMSGENAFEINPYTITNICSTLSGLTAQKIIEDNDKSKFGFDNSIDISVTANGTEYTLHVGESAPTGESIYVMKEGSDNIYLIDYTSGIILCATKDSLKSPYIANMLHTEVDHFALWNGKESDENVVFDMDKVNNSWEMKKPYPDMSVNNADVTTFINVAIRDEIYSFVAEDCQESDYEKYGFDDPQYVFEISGNGRYIKVIFGDNTKNNTEMYGLFTETGQVVTFYNNSVGILAYTSADLMDKYIFRKTLNEISEMHIETPDFSTDAKIDTENNKYFLDDNEIIKTEEDEEDNEGNNELYAAYLTFLSSVNDSYFDTVDKKAEPEGEPEVKIVYTLTDGSETTIEYIPVTNDDESDYWVMINGKYSDFIVKNKVVANFTATYNSLSELLNK